MRRRLVAIIALVILAAAAAVFRYTTRQRAQEEREAAYQSSLRSYSEILRPGMTRQQVKEYLRDKGILFHQRSGRKTAAVVTKIAEENPPWYCSERNIYVAFEFRPIKHLDNWEADDSDILEDIRISKWDQACL